MMWSWAGVALWLKVNFWKSRPIVGFENILHNLIPAVLQLVKADNILIVAINVD